MKLLKKTWQWLEGKKTNIGTTIMLIAQGIQVFAPNMMPTAQVDYITTVGAVIAGVGLFNKGVKTDTVQKLMHCTTKPKGK